MADSSDSVWVAQLRAHLASHGPDRPVQLSPEQALFAAVKRGDHEAMKQAVADGADVCAPEHIERDPASLSDAERRWGHSTTGATALHYAAERDDCKALVLLLNAAANDSAHYPMWEPDDPEFGNTHMWEMSEGLEPASMSKTSPGPASAGQAAGRHLRQPEARSGAEQASGEPAESQLAEG